MKRNGKYIDKNETIKWYKNGKLHRDDDLPAVIWKEGTQEWYQHGLRHRENNPAIIRKDSLYAWWLNGNCHREDGPAITHVYGSYQNVFHEYFILGVKLTQEEFSQYLEKKKFSVQLNLDLNPKNYHKKTKI